MEADSVGGEFSHEVVLRGGGANYSQTVWRTNRYAAQPSPACLRPVNPVASQSLLPRPAQEQPKISHTQCPLRPYPANQRLLVLGHYAMVDLGHSELIGSYCLVSGHAPLVTGYVVRNILELLGTCGASRDGSEVGIGGAFLPASQPAIFTGECVPRFASLLLFHWLGPPKSLASSLISNPLCPHYYP